MDVNGVPYYMVRSLKFRCLNADINEVRFNVTGVSTTKKLFDKLNEYERAEGVRSPSLILWGRLVERKVSSSSLSIKRWKQKNEPFCLLCT